MTWYADGDKGNFVAVCPHKGHGACRMWRRSTEHPFPESYPAQGRPLGLLAAWIREGQKPGCDEREDHKAICGFLAYDLRFKARLDFIEEPGALALAVKERKVRTGEGLEPFDMP